LALTGWSQSRIRIVWVLLILRSSADCLMSRRVESACLEEGWVGLYRLHTVLFSFSTAECCVLMQHCFSKL